MEKQGFLCIPLDRALISIREIFGLPVSANVSREIVFNCKLIVIPLRRWLVRKGREGISLKIG